MKNNCPVCDSKSFFLLYAKDHHYSIPGSWNINKCENVQCEHIFQYPIPTEEELIDYYDDDYYAYSPPKTDFHTNFLKLKNIGVFFHKSYLKKYKGYNHLNILSNSITSFIGKLINYYSGSFSFPNFVKNGKLLDYGSGAGDSVSFAKEIGWNSEGIEISTHAALVGKGAGLSILNGSIDILEGNNKQYDCIMTSHCVEHVPDVKRLFEGFHKNLRKGGTLLIDIPNGDSSSFKIFKRYYFYLGLPVHVNIFTVKSIKVLATSTGFKIKSISSYNRLKTQASTLELINRKNINKSDEKLNYYRRMSFRLAYYMIKALFLSYDRKQLKGDCLIIELEK